MENSGILKILKMPVIFDNKEWNDNELEVLLEKSIQSAASECLSANKGQILTTLSGGLDSSLCLAIIRKHFPKAKILTFTVGKSKYFPDIVFAELVARQFKTAHHEIIPTDIDIKISLDMKNRYPHLFPGENDRHLGGIGVWMVYSYIQNYCMYIERMQQPFYVIAHDGIDELMGGYWAHRDPKADQEAVFRLFWSQLWDFHLAPLLAKANAMMIKVLFPFLDPGLVEYISHIPVDERTDHKESKIIIKRIARKYLPSEIVDRKKSGFGQVL